MALLRHLTYLASRPGALDVPRATQPSAFTTGGSPRGREGIGGLHGAIGALPPKRPRRRPAATAKVSPA